jgi:hypothetical protein
LLFFTEPGDADDARRLAVVESLGFVGMVTKLTERAKCCSAQHWDVAGKYGERKPGTKRVKNLPPASLGRGSAKLNLIRGDVPKRPDLELGI